jgi:hypothetical protein
MATILTEKGHFKRQPSRKRQLQNGNTFKIKVMPKRSYNKPISIKVEFNELIAAHRNSDVVGAIWYVLSDQ